MKNNLKQIRQAQNLTQEQLASLVQVSRQTIISIETSKYIPSVLLSIKIATILHFNINEIFMLEDKDWL